MEIGLFNTQCPESERAMSPAVRLPAIAISMSRRENLYCRACPLPDGSAPMPLVHKDALFSHTTKIMQQFVRNTREKGLFFCTIPQTTPSHRTPQYNVNGIISPPAEWKNMGKTDGRSDVAFNAAAPCVRPSPQICASYCSTIGATYAGVEWGHECFCGSSEDYSRHGTSADCTMMCEANPDEICGGFLAIEVRGTGLAQDRGRDGEGHYVDPGSPSLTCNALSYVPTLSPHVDAM